MATRKQLRDVIQNYYTRVEPLEFWSRVVEREVQRDRDRMIAAERVAREELSGTSSRPSRTRSTKQRR